MWLSQCFGHISSPSPVFNPGILPAGSPFLIRNAGTQGGVRFPPGSPGSMDVQSYIQHSRLSLPIHRPSRAGAFSWLCWQLQRSCAASSQIPVVGCRLQLLPSHLLSSVINRRSLLSLIISQCRTSLVLAESAGEKNGICQPPRRDPVGKSSQLWSGSTWEFRSGFPGAFVGAQSGRVLPMALQPTQLGVLILWE